MLKDPTPTLLTFPRKARPALETFYEIAGRVLSIRTFDEWSARWAERFIAGWHLTPVAGHAGEVGCTLEVRRGAPPAIPFGWPRFEVPYGYCYTNQVSSCLAVDGSVVIVHPSTTRLIEIRVNDARAERPSLARLFFHGMQMALRRCGLYELHAAGVAQPESGAGALIIGASGSGKSTLTVRLALSGWQYISDDFILLYESAGGAEARGLRRVFALTEATVATCDLPRIDEATRPTSEFDPCKRRLDPQVMFPAGFTESCLPKALFFPMVTAQATSHVIGLTQYEAMAQLIRVCPWACYDTPVAREHLHVLSRLARQCVSYLLKSGRDIFERPDFASELLAAHMEA